MLTRRTLLASPAALALIAAARPGADEALRSLLDTLDPRAPADSLKRLDALKPKGLSPSARLDYDAVRQGLAVDARIAAAGKPDFVLGFERAFGQRLKPTQVHQRLSLSMAEVAVRAAMLLRAEGLTDGSIGARLTQLARDSRHLYPDSDAGRAQAVADMNRWLVNARSHVAEIIAGLPPGGADAIVRSLSPQDIAAGRGGYRDPATAGRPAAYVVDLREIRRRPYWTLPSVVAHELFPGHLPQAVFQTIADPHPLRLRYAPSFSEGWAIYAEMLCDGLGMFKSDRLCELGHLQWMLFRLGRAIVDHGIHLEGWDDATARAHLERWQGDPVVFAPFAQELERIRANPGARAAEAMGALAILDLRDKLKVRQGPRIAAFHYAVIRDGAMPFGLLGAHVRKLLTPVP